MKKAEVILGILALISGIGVLIPVPGLSIPLLISLLGLGTIYYAFARALFNNIGFRASFKKASFEDIPSTRIRGAFITGIALSAVCVGLLFKLLFWGGGAIMLLVGVTAVSIASVVAMIGYSRTKDRYFVRILIRTGIIGGLGLLLLAPIDLYKIKYRNHPACIAAYEAYQANPQDEALFKKMILEERRVQMSPEEFEYYLKSQDNP